jgi:hypothetical protein
VSIQQIPTNWHHMALTSLTTLWPIPLTSDDKCGARCMVDGRFEWSDPFSNLRSITVAIDSLKQMYVIQALDKLDVLRLYLAPMILGKQDTNLRNLNRLVLGGGVELWEPDMLQFMHSWPSLRTLIVGPRVLQYWPLLTALPGINSFVCTESRQFDMKEVDLLSYVSCGIRMTVGHVP